MTIKFILLSSLLCLSQPSSPSSSWGAFAVPQYEYPSSSAATIVQNENNQPQVITNVALGKTATQISTRNNKVASIAIDDNTDGDNSIGEVAMTGPIANPWWKVNLSSNSSSSSPDNNNNGSARSGNSGDPEPELELEIEPEMYEIHEIKIYRRTDTNSAGTRTVGMNKGFIVEIIKDGPKPQKSNHQDAENDNSNTDSGEEMVVWSYAHPKNVIPNMVEHISASSSPSSSSTTPVFGNVVRVRLEGEKRNLQLAEVDVYATKVRNQVEQEQHQVPVVNVAIGTKASASQISTGGGGGFHAFASKAIDRKWKHQWQF